MSRCKLLILTLFTLVSCKGYLTVQPQGKVIPETDEEFASIIHRHLDNIEGGADQYILGNMETIARLEGCADDLDANIRPGNGLPSYAGEVINARMTDYRECYEIIRDCNIVRENLQGRDSPTARGALGAACAIEGIVYYNLMRDFCQPWGDGSEPGLPLVTVFDIEAMPERSTLGETADLVESLLAEAASLCPLGGEFFFDADIIDFYLARTAFWREDWAGCRRLCEGLLKGRSLTPAGEYGAMLASATPTGEVLAKSHINNASELDWYFQYLKGYIASRPAGASLFGLHADGDVRKGLFFDSRRCNAKLPECRLRLSEAVLMLAECCAHLGDEDGALKALNQVRTARMASTYTAESLPAVRADNRITVDATGKGLTPLMQAVLDERRRELYMEGDRFYELKRNGSPQWWVIVGGLKYTTKPYLYTAPIYKGDIDLNPKLQQNPGYED